jgi:MOSC domain-containing protein YiiM
MLTVTGRFVRADAPGSTFERKRIAPRRPAQITAAGFVRPDDGQQSFTSNVRMPDRCYHAVQDALDRAVLVQTEAHWIDVRCHFSEQGTSLHRPLPPAINGGDFGENILCRGASADDLCIGDKVALVDLKRDWAEVGRRHKRGRADREDDRLLLQITSPRRPCSKVDKKFGQTWDGGGVRAYCARSGRAGFLCRVLVPGVLPADGCILRVVERPFPHWTLSRVSSLLYGIEGAVDAPGYSLPGFDHTTPSLTRGTGGGRSAVLAKWKGTEEELAELANLEPLAGFEWQDELRAMHEAVISGDRTGLLVSSSATTSLWLRLKEQAIKTIPDAVWSGISSFMR